MDYIFSSFQHLGQLPRQLPSAVPLDSIGYIAHKTNWVRHRFGTYNFSFILSGGGEYWREGVRWNVQAPCVITQAPGRLVEYGPSGAWREWEELFLIYNQDQVPVLTKMGLIRNEVPVWSIKNIGPTRTRLQELKQAGTDDRGQIVIDRLDRLCELMLVESILGETSAARSPEERAILEIRDYLKLHYLEPHDFSQLARNHGLSDSTFRRRWAALVGMPPARYVMRLKIEEACRLLVETGLKVGEVAQALGFSDPLYFSRRFHLVTGVTAAAYRLSHQTPLSFIPDLVFKERID